MRVAGAGEAPIWTESCQLGKHVGIETKCEAKLRPSSSRWVRFEIGVTQICAGALLSLALDGCSRHVIQYEQARSMADSRFQDYANQMQIAIWAPSPTEEKDEPDDFLFRYRTTRGIVTVLVRKTGEIASALDIR